MVNLLECHYCHSKVTLYKKEYKNQYTYENWLTCSSRFTSCKNLFCPYHFKLEPDKEFIMNDGELIRYREMFIASEVFDDPGSIQI